MLSTPRSTIKRSGIQKFRPFDSLLVQSKQSLQQNAEPEPRLIQWNAILGFGIIYFSLY